MRNEVNGVLGDGTVREGGLRSEAREMKGERVMR